MSTYSLIAVVEGFDLDSEEQNAALDRLEYAAVVGMSGGIVTVDADVAAPSSIDAFNQLTSDLRAIGAHVVRIELELVTVAEIAERFEVSRETARLWTVGKRRGGFPAHYQHVGGNRVWAWPDVFAWAEMCEVPLEEYPPMSREEITALNGALAHVRNARHDGWLTSTGAPRVRIDPSRRVPTRRGWGAPVRSAA
jgi:hypothetical protein